MGIDHKHRSCAERDENHADSLADREEKSRGPLTYLEVHLT